MSVHRIIQRSLATAFVLSVTGMAFARQPPALTKAQRATERAIACEGATAQSGAGYRAAFVRFGPQRESSPSQVAKASPGYRGMKGSGTGNAASHVACTQPAQRPHRT